MKAVVFHGVGDIRLDNVPEPTIKGPFDAIVRLTSSAICGTDLHMIRGTLPGMRPGTILGHEGVGVVEEVGENVRNLKRGDRVVIPSTIACGSCSYCRSGYTAQCDDANPNGPLAGTAFFGGPEASGPFDGLQAEYARIPYANVNLVRLPDEVDDDQAIPLSDIAPTGWFGADIASIEPGKSVAVFGAGPVGLFAMVAAWHMGAERVFAVDNKPDRLEMARNLGAECVDFGSEDPVGMLRELTGGIGPDRVIEAVGVDSEAPEGGPATESGGTPRPDEVKEAAPETNPQGEVFKPGNAPALAAEWAVQSVAKAGLISVIGVYPPTNRTYPFGMAMQKNLSIRMGNANHKKYVAHLVGMVREGSFDPSKILTNLEPVTGAIEAYKVFDRRKPGWIKVELDPAA